jgi:ferredoxin
MSEEKTSLNFHAPEFNRPDDLNDWSQNYRSFESLEDVVTADMRHQEERLENNIREGGSARERPHSKNSATEGKVEGATATPVPLTIISRGRTLIIGKDVERAIACARTLSEKKLTCSILVTDGIDSDTVSHGLRCFSLLHTDGASVRGAFGRFETTVSVKGEQQPLTKRFGDEAAAFDLVLDLQPVHSFEGTSPPIGYYFPGPDPAAFDEALAEMAEMRGRFEKPQFVDLRKAYCFHGKSRARDCRRCVEVCPVGAIQSADGVISINHYLCQGCGGCALVCPADAINLIEPSRDKTLGRLQNLLQTRCERAQSGTTLTISDLGTLDSMQGRNVMDDESNIIFEVDRIAFVGADILLAALAYGAGNILLTCGPQTPPAIRTAVELQVQTARAILRGLGMPEGTIRFVAASSQNTDTVESAGTLLGPEPSAGRIPLEPAMFPSGLDRRALVRLASRYLYDQSPVSDPRLILPAGSPFGAVTVAGLCTLCMACTGACPSGALSTNGDLPQLVFRESQCHQCGLCEEICPEKALRLQPRMLCDLPAVEAPVVLRRVEPFRCVECGTPFATVAMIDRMTEKLKGHWMFTDERQIRRLKMCADCRTRDTLMSEDMRLWNSH